MAYPEPHPEPYTKYPNRYNDVIKPLLTDTQRDICDVVIRMTYGWHQTSAEISNSVFLRKSNKSKQGIIKAKKQLEEMGLLMVLQKGGGSKTSRYMIDLYYDNPDRSVKASIIRQEEQLHDIQIAEENTPELTEPDSPPEESEISVSEEAINADSDSSYVEEGGKLSFPPSRINLRYAGGKLYMV